MSAELWIAAGGVFLSALVAGGSACVVIFNAGAVKGRIDTFGEKLSEVLVEMRESRKDRSRLEVHERRLTQVEQDHTEQRRLVSAIHKKVFSHDKHIAVTREQIRQSRPDLGGHDE